MKCPIYRAKKIGGDEYVIGWFWCQDGKPNITEILTTPKDVGIYQGCLNYEIDPSTLAIHFPDMIDSEGTKIFASLSEDGKGGDKLSFDGKEFGNVFIKGGAMQVNDEEDNEISYLNSYNTQIKVIGIQE